jgi:VanZ family protein
MLRPLRLRTLWIALGLLGLGLTLLVCLLPSVPGPSFTGADKLEHLLTWLVITAWFASLVERRGYAWVALAMVAIGIGIEFAQDWMALGREGDWHDVVANSGGVLAGLLVAATNRDGWFALVERWLPAT